MKFGSFLTSLLTKSLVGGIYQYLCSGASVNFILSNESQVSALCILQLRAQTSSTICTKMESEFKNWLNFPFCKHELVLLMS